MRIRKGSELFNLNQFLMTRPLFNAGHFFVLGMMILPPWGVQAERPPKSITFRHTRRATGQAKEPRKVESSDGKVVLKVEGERFKGTVRLFDVATGKPLGPTIQPVDQPQLSSYRITALAIASDNKTVATAIGNSSNDFGAVRVWDATTGKEITHYNGPDDLGEVYTLSFSPDGKVLSITSGEAGGK